jgi:ethanolamine ammonia-lyase small subunit
MPRGCDLAFVMADGLSARAVASHALPLLDATLPLLRRNGWQIGPVAVVEQGRVAIGDDIGSTLGAGLVCVLIGERPGLTSPDSLGAYLTWQPKVGRTDAERNCLSNIRPEGMPYAEAAQRLIYLCTQARLRRCTGVALKDETPLNPVLAPAGGEPLPAGGEKLEKPAEPTIHAIPEHDPEKWPPVFGKDHAPAKR